MGRADIPENHKASSTRNLPGFADFVEAFCKGFNACRDGLSDSDGEEFMRGLMVAYENTGSRRAQRYIQQMVG